MSDEKRLKKLEKEVSTLRKVVDAIIDDFNKMLELQKVQNDTIKKVISKTAIVVDTVMSHEKNMGEITSNLVILNKLLKNIPIDAKRNKHTKDVELSYRV